ncbi:MAG TPA: DUF2203 domain-containing protein [Candidatus Eisenbacteria bacterium]|nr:DUF2203 domain-containing protein [Candidatus Eisenbacteria bacterium]
MRTRSFTVEQADACVPRLRLLLERVQRNALRLHREREAVAMGRGGDPGAIRIEDVLAERPELRRLVEELDAAVGEIEELGVELKDVDLGLVDFPAVIDGVEVYLCWQFGEDRVRFFHRRTEGFAGRRALRGLPPAPEVQ